MWKPTQQEALWFHGGNLHHPALLALFGAAVERVWKDWAPVYGLQPVHHVS